MFAAIKAIPPIAGSLAACFQIEDQRRTVKQTHYPASEGAQKSLEHFTDQAPDPILGWAVQWAKSGLPQIVLGHRLAASLMATSMERANAEHVCLPWKAFAIVVPDRLVSAPSPGSGATEFITGAHVTRFSDGCVSVFATSDSGCVWSAGIRHVRDLGDIDALWERGSRSLRDADVRALGCLDRLILGTCAELSTPEASRAIAQHAGSEADRGEGRLSPSVWSYTLRREVRVDCREAIRAFVNGGGRRPNVQTLVRGHWKRQHHGPRAELVKWIAVEPYWRGPEEAPIAVRSHRLMEVS
jgi:hypothetical protein